MAILRGSVSPQVRGMPLEKIELPIDFKPNDFDVICGKGKKCYNHIGNQNFRKIIGNHLSSYLIVESKLEKSIIVSKIINFVRTQGGFVKFDKKTKLWHEVGDSYARERVGQTIRDALHHQYRSSTKAKKRRSQKAISKAPRFSDRYFELVSKIECFQTGLPSISCDQQLINIFTKVNLDLLNELNAMREKEKQPVPPPKVPTLRLFLHS